MAFVPTRFIHASNLRLDHQPQGVGAVSRQSQTHLEDCTLITFEEIIKACLKHEIHFLLLTGNSFIEEDHSIRARVALMDGFQQLASHNIQVFVIPGQHDPLSAWDLQTNWPDHVTFLSPQDEDRLDIIYDDEIVGTLQMLDAAQYKLQQPVKLNKRNQLFNQHDHRVYSIGCITTKTTSEPTDVSTELNRTATPNSSEDPNDVSVDYLALCKGTQRHTFEMQPGIAHHPGAAQGLNFDERENNSVTLVTVHSEEPVDYRPLNVAAIRWLEIALELNAETSRSQLKKIMEHSLQSQRAASHEKLWMVHWKFIGAGDLFETLRSVKRQHELSTELANEFNAHLPVVLEQSFSLEDLPAASRKNTSDLIQLYQRQIEEFQQKTESPLNHLLNQSTQLDHSWHQRLSELTAQINEQDIFNSAIQNGNNGLSISSDEEVHI